MADLSDLKQNYNPILESSEYVNFEKKIDKLIEFLNFLSILMRDYGCMNFCITSLKVHFFQPVLIDSSVKTLNSIKYCCKFGSFSDANTLVRKFRDDLMLFLYILEVLNNRKVISAEENQEIIESGMDCDKLVTMCYSSFDTDVNGCMKNDDDISIDAWFNNNVNNLLPSQKKKLCIKNYLNYLETNKCIAEILEKYNLKDDWEKIRKILNDYTHNNGQSHTQHNIMSIQSKNIEKCFAEIIERLDFMTALFLILLILIDPSMIKSTDYIDYLECGLTPPEDSQYYIAPFIQEFIDEYINQINPELKVFLKHNNKYGMLID